MCTPTNLACFKTGPFDVEFNNSGRQKMISTIKTKRLLYSLLDFIGINGKVEFRMRVLNSIKIYTLCESIMIYTDLDQRYDVGKQFEAKTASAFNY